MTVASSPFQWHQPTVPFVVPVAYFLAFLVCFVASCVSCPHRIPCCQLSWRRKRREGGVSGGIRTLDDPGTCREWVGYPCSLFDEEGAEFQHQLEGGKEKERERENHIQKTLLVSKRDVLLHNFCSLTNF